MRKPSARTLRLRRLYRAYLKAERAYFDAAFAPQRSKRPYIPVRLTGAQA